MSANRLWSLLSFILVYQQIECKKSTRQLPSTIAYNSPQYQDQSLSIFYFALYYMKIETISSIYSRKIELSLMHM